MSQATIHDEHRTREPEVETDAPPQNTPRVLMPRSFDIDGVRADFPILNTRASNAKPLIYFDNAASAQKPRVVIERLQTYYKSENANIHRGVHYLSQVATREYEAARLTVRDFLHAAHDREIIFLRGATEAINLVASSFSKRFLHSGDEVIVSTMEHHANIVPWQLACEERGATLRVIPINDAGELDLGEYSRMLNERTKFVSVTHISNALGTINDVREIIRLAHERNIPVLLDGAQSAPYMKVNVQELDCDFFCFSGHKTFGPTGIGVLYGKEKWLDALPPYQGGGDMIDTVTFEKTTFNALPFKFEAGTPNIAGALGLASALDYMESFGVETLQQREDELLVYASARIVEIPGIRIIGTAREKAGILSFVHQSANAGDLGMALDEQGVAIRTGHHCTQPLMRRYGISGTARASFTFYNTREEVDIFIDALKKAVALFA
jgi:cysteine desulfurase/selenocysteine lyase